MFRSEEMALCQVFLHQEAAFATVALLGEAGIVQFRDLNAEVHPFMRKFVGEVRRCEELERKLRFIAEELHRDGVSTPPAEPAADMLHPSIIAEIEGNLEKAESEIIELSSSAGNLQANFVELSEMKQVLEKAQAFLREMEELPAKALGVEDLGQLGFIAGVLPRTRVNSFERMLWRVSRGNVFFRQADLEDLVMDPATGEKLHKTVFVVLFHGDSLRSAVLKVCSGFRANTYPCPSAASERTDMVRELRTRLQDHLLILSQTRLHRRRVLGAVRKDLRNWFAVVLKTKAIYHTLNMFNMDVTKRCLIGECWVPVSDLHALREVLLLGGNAVGSTVPSFLNVIPAAGSPPTYIRTNKFTAGYQALIDAYAVNSYREVNPAAYATVTFPFLFAVMFGDLGHGFIMALFALFLVWKEKVLERKVAGNEIMTIFFGGRYILLMMGLFSMYTGLMYNDVFSVSANLFRSSWHPNYDLSTIMDNKHLTLDPATDAFEGTPYPVGLDPVWQFADNKIIFLNSLKMKLSIIIGVIHMIFGVCLSVINYVNTKRPSSILFEFLPQLLFLVLLFGYLAMLMVLKWWKYDPSSDDVLLSPMCAPSVLITFISMMLRNSPSVPPGCERWMYAGQEGAERVLLLAALACVPCMLLAKPAYLVLTGRARVGKPSDQGLSSRPVAKRPIEGMSDDEDDDGEEEVDDGDEPSVPVAVAPSDSASAEPLVHADGEDDDIRRPSETSGDEEPFSEIVVHQCIHTVEYVLSTVSHTASYLRLWALSLAHAQLSHVLWSMLLRMGLRAPFWRVFPLPVIFSVWAFFTVTILVLMEGLSAFLHTLRLHWVEFMSKFYEGEGYAFHPFAFKALIQTASGEEGR